MSSGSEGANSEPPSAVLPDSSAAPRENSRPVSHHPLFWIAGGLATVWILGLLILALTTANPVTLNRKQIQQSHFVVTASREHGAASTLVVSKEWKHGRELGKIAVINLDKTKMPAGEEFLVPLQRVVIEDEETPQFAVTRTTLPNEAPLIYPATPEAKSALEELLNEGP